MPFSCAIPRRAFLTTLPALAKPRIAVLEELARNLSGRGAVLHNGRTIHTWGDQTEVSDWLSSAKPVLSTLLFFAIAERKVRTIDALLLDQGWPLIEKDRSMTLRHLANMTSAYARPDVPGSAWAYNDFAINLYQKTLFDRVFRQDPDTAANSRFAPLGLQDGLRFRPTNRRMSASVRDFARIAQFWLARGKHQGRQILPKHLFTSYCRPQTPANLPHTQRAETNDYLMLGTYGGGSDHFTDHGAGIYGCNWWFNAAGRLHPNAITWPDATQDTFMSIGAGGNCAVMIPSRKTVLLAARANWGKHTPGDAAAPANQHIKLLLQALS
ncbi:MAG: serine hydrolase [Bryobacterales bacterium]|nr:serine hydrolase [Bryobacterales bacterium]